jgi:hypothetical protein
MIAISKFIKMSWTRKVAMKNMIHMVTAFWEE